MNKVFQRNWPVTKIFWQSVLHKQTREDVRTRPLLCLCGSGYFQPWEERILNTKASWGNELACPLHCKATTSILHSIAPQAFQTRDKVKVGPTKKNKIRKKTNRVRIYALENETDNKILAQKKHFIHESTLYNFTLRYNLSHFITNSDVCYNGFLWHTENGLLWWGPSNRCVAHWFSDASGKEICMCEIKML